MSSESTALAVISPTAEAEALPKPETVIIPAAIMLAAETIADPKGNQTYYDAVYLHARDRRGRVVSTDGQRMFVASFILEGGGKMPSWMGHGLLLSGTGLKTRLSMLAKGEEARVKVTHVKGTHRAQLTDVDGDIAFNIETVSATYPDYEKVIGADSFVDLDGDGQARGHEWKPIGIGSGYLKQCGDIARLLDNGRPKSEREKTGMVVRAFTGDQTRPVVFDFPGWPGAVLFVMPMKIANGSISKETAALLAPAVRGSIAALKAHSTRWLQVAKAATSDQERTQAIAKSKEFLDRIAGLMERAPVAAISDRKAKAEAEAPATEPTPEIQPQPEEPTPEPELQDEAQAEAQEGAPGPKVTRKKIKVKAAAE